MGFGDWLRRKVSKKEEVPEEEQLQEEATNILYDTSSSERVRAEEAERLYKERLDDIRQQEERAKRAESERDRWRQYGDRRAPGEDDKAYNDRMAGEKWKGYKSSGGSYSSSSSGGQWDPSQMTPDEQKAYKKRIEEAKKAKTQAAFEVWETGVRNKKKVISKVWRQAHYVNELGQPIPEPTTPEEKAKAKYVPGEWVFVPVEQEVTPTEQLQEAIAIKHLQRQSMIEEESIKDFKRERSLPHRVARGAGQFAQGMVATTITGTAGMARGIMPSQRGSRQAAATLMPRVDPSLYSVGAPPPTQSGLRPVGGLSHLRSALLPRANTTATRRIRPF